MSEKMLREAASDALDLIQAEYGLLDSKVIGVADIVSKLQAALQSQAPEGKPEGVNGTTPAELEGYKLVPIVLYDKGQEWRLFSVNYGLLNDISLRMEVYASDVNPTSPTTPTATASQESAPGQEAVAWRWMSGDKWVYGDTRPVIGAHTAQPLYLAPPTVNAAVAALWKMSAQIPAKVCTKCWKTILVTWPPTEHECEPPMKDEDLWPCPKDTATIAAEIESDAYHAKSGRKFTYTGQQPQNVDAWRIGEACRKAADDPKCGDYIDRGLILLKELETKGYGVFIIDAAIKSTKEDV